jgi:hypothetical protein
MSQQFHLHFSFQCVENLLFLNPKQPNHLSYDYVSSLVRDPHSSGLTLLDLQKL